MGAALAALAALWIAWAALAALWFVSDFCMGSYNNLNSHQSNFIIIAIKYNKFILIYNIEN